MTTIKDTITLGIQYHAPDTIKIGVVSQTRNMTPLMHYQQRRIDSGLIHSSCREISFILNAAVLKKSDAGCALNRLKKEGRFLYDHLFTGPLKNKLKSSEGINLILLLDEELISFPWEFLYDGEDFLCLKFNLGRLIRTKRQPTINYRENSLPLKMLILANPAGDLSGAYSEGEYLKNNLLNRTEYIRADFKSNDVTSCYLRKNLSEYDMVHFAGHCENFNDSKGNAGWVLKDGKFSAGDIINMGESSALPSLIFSNACLSALLFKDNFIRTVNHFNNFSLAYGFLFSGVKHYIGAVSFLDDYSGVDFSAEFYTQLIKNKSVGEAVRFSRLKMFKGASLMSVLCLTYVLYGDPSCVLLKPDSNRRKIGYGIRYDKKTFFAKKIIASSLAALIIILFCLKIFQHVFPSANLNSGMLLNKAQAFLSKGMNKEAEDIYARLIKNDKFFRPAYPGIVESCLRQGKRDIALKYYFDYLLAAGKNHDNKGLISAYIGIGWIYYQKLQLEKSYEFYDLALVLSRQKNDRASEAVVLRKLALLYMEKPDYSFAMDLLMKSSEINREGGSGNGFRYNLACDYFDIGLLFANKNDFAAAKGFYDKSMDLFNKLSKKDEASDYYFNMGEICIFEKRYQDALDNYMKGLKVDEMFGNLLNMAGDYTMIGDLYSQMGRFTDARDMFLKSLELSKRNNLSPEFAEACLSLGLLYKDSGDIREAKEYLIQAEGAYCQLDSPELSRVKQEIVLLDKLLALKR